MPLPIPPNIRKAIAGKAPDPNDPIGEEEDPDLAEAAKKGGKPNPLKRWAASKAGVPTKGMPPVPPQIGR